MRWYKCERCGANLDPGEHCECREEKNERINRMCELFHTENNGQLVLREVIDYGKMGCI